MKQYLGYIGTFLLGVVCTVVVYETVRVVTTARQALSAASAQMTLDEEPEAAVADARKTRKGQGKGAKKGLPDRGFPKGGLSKSDQTELLSKRRLMRMDGKAKPGMPDAFDRRSRRLERIKERRKQKWESLTPEEKEHYREVKRQREEARAARGDAPGGERDPLDDEAFDRRSDDEGEEFVDTGLK